MVATSVPRRHIIGRPTGRRKLGVIGGVALFLGSIANFVLYEMAHVLETLVGFYLVVGVGAVLACYAAYHSGGLLLSWVMTFGAVSGAVLQYWSFRQGAKFGGVPVKPPYFVYGFNAVEFWIPIGFLLGTVAYAIGVSLRKATDQ